MPNVLQERNRMGRPRIKWIEDVEADLQKLSIIGWTFIASDREAWTDIARKSLIHIEL